MIISLILGLAAAMLIGVLIGAIAIGGVLLPPVLIYVFGMSVREAMATSLATFIFTGLLGAYFFKKSGSLDLRSGIILSLGSLLLWRLHISANFPFSKQGIHEIRVELIERVILAFWQSFSLLPNKSGQHRICSSYSRE